MLGAGSGFTPPLMNDLLSIPGMLGGEIALCDIDERRLVAIARVIEMLIEQLELGGVWSVSASSQRRDLLADADYLINCIEVSGLDCVRLDNEIPARFGVDQCIGDTIGPGGLFKGLRTIPVWLEVLRDCEDLCPDAIVLNYTNPMSMLCLAAARSSFMKVVGLCHSVQGTSEMLAKRVGLPLAEIEWECAGINHLAWFTKFRSAGRDLYPDLIERARADRRPSDHRRAGRLGRQGLRDELLPALRHLDADLGPGFRHGSGPAPPGARESAAAGFWPGPGRPASGPPAVIRPSRSRRARRAPGARSSGKPVAGGRGGAWSD